jgi:hypothetical protein
MFADKSHLSSGFGNMASWETNHGHDKHVNIMLILCSYGNPKIIELMGDFPAMAMITGGFTLTLLT